MLHLQVESKLTPFTLLLFKFDTEQLQYNEIFHKTDKRIRLLLPKQMRANILQMIDN